MGKGQGCSLVLQFTPQRIHRGSPMSPEVWLMDRHIYAISQVLQGRLMGRYGLSFEAE